MTDRPDGTPYDRVQYVEKRISEVVGDERFIPHLVLHETETLVLAAADQVAELMLDPGLGRQLHRAVDEAGGAELVNDHPTTAPSKRLQALFPTCRKATDGSLAVCDLGLSKLRGRCPHLDGWLKRLEALADR